MRVENFDDKTDELLGKDNREPVCGEDLCATCGDCLHCYGGDACYSRGGGHRWVDYVKSEQEEKP